MKRIWAFFMMSLVLAATGGLDSAWAAPNPTAYRQALEAVRNGRNQKAIELLTQAIRRSPQDHRLYNDRGVAYKRSGDLEKALVDYTKSLEIKPDFTNALNNRGVVYLLKGALDKAIADLSRALKCGGLEEKIYTNLGLAFAEKGDHQAAIQSFNKALSYGPSDHRVFLFMAKSMEETGAIEKAIQMCRLARGFAKGPEATALIDREIDRLQKKQDASVSARTGTVPRAPEAKAAHATQSLQKRIIVRARPPEQLNVPIPNAPAPNDKKNRKIESLQALESYARTTAQAKLSPVAAGIYMQGRQFLEKSDLNKALVRFEDTRDLERRKRSFHAVAWSDLEIGRVLTRMGDHHKATGYFKEALRFFERLNAPEEWILACLELSSNLKTIDRKEEATELYKKAVQKAVSSGYYDLARAIGGSPSKKPEQGRQTAVPVENKAVRSASVRPPSVLKPTRQSPPGAESEAARRQPARDQTGAPEKKKPKTEHMQWGAVGRGPINWAQSHPVVAPAPQASVGDRSAARESEARPSEKKGVQPQGAVLSARGLGPEDRIKPRPRQRTVRQEVAELHELRERNDERGMVLVLERMSETLLAGKQYETALHCLDAALGFRDKLRLEKGKAKAYQLRSIAREKLGHTVAALEDLTHSLFLGDTTSEKTTNALKQKVRSLAASLHVDPDKIFDAYATLWKARAAGDSYQETRSLHRIAQLCDSIGREKEALSYYERSLASLLADKARAYEAMGSQELASKTYNEALTAFKRLDYSRYMDLSQRKKIPNALSRQ
jgi:tetratricopeptide (TPR) repeat protein